MTNYNDVVYALQYLRNKSVFESICWEEMRDHGNSCVPWLHLPQSERIQYLDTKRNVEQALPMNSRLYADLSNHLKAYFGNQWVTYDFTIKVIARALAFIDCFYDFRSAVLHSRIYRSGLNFKPAPTI